MSTADEYVSRAEVLDLIEQYAAGPGNSIPGVIDYLHEAVTGLELRPLPDGGRRVIVELYAEQVEDLLYVEATRCLSVTEAMRWLVRTGTNEAVRREQKARQMARVLQVSVLEAREYVDLGEAAAYDRSRVPGIG